MKFISDALIEYIDKNINEDTDLQAHFDVLEAYIDTNKVSSHQIQVQVADDSENTQYTTMYEGENIYVTPVQIDCYIVGNIKYKGKSISPIKGSLVLGDKIKQIFEKKRIMESIPQVVRCVRTSSSPALPLQNGTLTYVTALRFELQLIRE